MLMEHQETDKIVVDKGREVALAYTLSMADGTEVDSASQDDPFRFTIGDGSLFAALEQLLLGLSVGSRESFLLAAEDAFGVSDSELLHTLSRAEFDDSLELAPGMVFSFESPSGEQLPATVVEENSAGVLVDFNHPLASRDLRFEIEIISIRESRGEINEN